MTKSQKDEIFNMRGKGYSYAKIATTLSVSENTIKSYCQRNDMGGLSDFKGERCLHCKRPLQHIDGKKKKKFCSDICRLAWWNSHPGAINRKAIYKITCLFCGQEFESYGNKNRKYCCRACFGAARRASNDKL